MSDVRKGQLDRFQKHMEKIDDLALVVLKGHLILEEQIDRIVEKFVFHPEFLEKAELRLFQKVMLARSMSLDEHDNSMWDLLLTINSLRNELAHSLESDKRTRKCEKLRSQYFNIRARAASDDEVHSPDHLIAMFAISMVLGFLTSFEDEVIRFKQWVNVIDKSVNAHRHEKAKGK